MGIFSKLFNSLKKTKDNFNKLFSSLGFKELDDDFYEELKYILIASDMGVLATEHIIEQLKTYSKKNKIKSKDEFMAVLKEYLINMLPSIKETQTYPSLITFIGVNGVGKTTAIGKLAHYHKKQGYKVLVVAGDTFRAAASDQLTEWATKSGVRIVKYAEGADPGAVVYDGIASAKAKGDDLVLIDTAGRLHTKDNLMEELKKIKRIIEKEWQGKSYKNYLVIDATTGQNALNQVEIFNNAVKVDGIVLTKLDGTAKGGIVFAIAKQYNIPIVYVGVGEKLDDIEPFNAKEFVEGIF